MCAGPYLLTFTNLCNTTRGDRATLRGNKIACRKRPGCTQTSSQLSFESDNYVAVYVCPPLSFFLFFPLLIFFSF